MPLTLSEEEELELEMEMAKAGENKVNAQSDALQPELDARKQLQTTTSLQTRGAKGEELFVSGSTRTFPEDASWRDYIPTREDFKKVGSVVLDSARDWTQDNLGLNITKGFVNAPKHAAELGAAAGEYAGVLPEGSAQTVTDTIPEMDYESSSGELVGTAAPIVTGGIGGAAKGLSLANALAKDLPGVFKAAVAATTGTVAGGAVTDSETKAMITGDEDETEFQSRIAGLAINDKGEYDEVLLKRRLNVMIEGGVAAGIIGPTVKGGSAILGFLSDILGGVGNKFFSKVTQDALVAKEMVASVKKIDYNTTAAEEAAIYDEVAGLAEQHAKLKATNPHTGEAMEVPRDTMTTLEKGAKSAMEIEQVRGMRASMRGRGAPKMEATLKVPANTARDLSLQSERIAGGRPAVSDSLDAIQQSGIEEVRKASDDILPMSKKLADSEEGIGSLVKNEPMFKGIDATEIDVTAKKASLDKQTEVLYKGKDTRAVDKGERDDLYNAIPPKTKANMDNPPRPILDPETNLPVLDEAGNPTFMPDDSFNATYKSIRETLPGDIQDEIDRLIAGADGTFKYLNNVVRPRLSGRITDLFNQGKGTEAGELIKLRDNITEIQIGYLAEHGDEVSINAAKLANEGNKRYAAKWNDGVGKELQKNEKINRPKTQPIDFEEKGRPIIKNTVTDSNRPKSTQQLREIVGKENEGLITDIQLADAVEKVSQRLAARGGKLTDIDVEELSAPLRAANLTGEEAKRANIFLNKLRDKKFSSEDIKAELEAVKGRATQVEADVLDRELGNFFTKNGDSRVPKKGATNGQALFEAAFDDADAVAKVTSFVKRARESGDNLADEGLKAAYQRYRRENLFREAPHDPKNNAVINENTYQKKLDKMNEIGDVLYKDHPEVMEAQRLFDKEAGELALAQNKRGLPVADPAAIDKGARENMNVLITWWRGSLDRVGARMRGLGGRAITTLSKTDQVRNIMDELYANPEKFAKVVRQMQVDKAGRLDPQTKKNLWSFGVRAGVYQPEDKSEYDSYSMDSDLKRDVNKQTDTAFE